jgi:hypothetical protein
MIETIKNLYKEAIDDFFKKIKDIDVENMPLINIPAIGCGYKKDNIKIAIFGQDTNNSNLKKFGELKKTIITIKKMTLPALKAKLDPQITEILTAKIQQSTAKANKANKQPQSKLCGISYIVI